MKRIVLSLASLALAVVLTPCTGTPTRQSLSPDGCQGICGRCCIGMTCNCPQN